MSGAMYASMNGPPPGDRRPRATSAARASDLRSELAVQPRDEARIVLGSDVLAHLDRRGDVVGAVVDVAVVLQAHVDLTVQTPVGDVLLHELELLPRQGDARDARTVVLGGVEATAIPIRSRRRAAAYPAARSELVGECSASFAACASSKEVSAPSPKYAQE